MWNAGIGAKKKPRKKKSKKYELKLRRTTAQLRIESLDGSPGSAEVVDARILLNDFKKTGIDLFCQSPIHMGRKVSVTLEFPKQFFCKAKVIACRECPENGRRVVSDSKPFMYRITVKFLFDGEDHQASIHNYWSEINREFVASPVLNKQKAAA